MPSNSVQMVHLPMKWVGPIKLINSTVDEVRVPLITYEAPLWPSVSRGAHTTKKAGGILATVMDERMTRSILMEAPDAQQALFIWEHLKQRQLEMNQIVSKTSRFAKLINLTAQFVGHLFYIRFEFSTGDAAGHNMVTLASEQLQSWLKTEYPNLIYRSISSNYCSDKKATAVNGILGRGKKVIAEVTIPAKLCKHYLKTTPNAIHTLNIQKNLMGSVISGSIRSANAHFSNMLLAFYLATGQDAANIVEGSQGFTYTAIKEEALYFSVTLPNLIVGTVGNGKTLPFVQDNLHQMKCDQTEESGFNARRLARICAATVLCGELSLLAAQTNEGELMQSHLKLERT